MRYRRLGRTALRVSELCLGTMNFGPLTSEADAGIVMDRALEHGINFFDTANRYGGDKGPGATESIVGRWFAQGGGRREKVVLATKVFGPMTEWPNDGGLSARHIRDACDASLRRLQTDHIDLYQMHHVDRHAPWDEVWQAMETLVAAGKVIYVGSSNFAGWHIAQANEAAKHRNFLGLVSEQSLYNLASRTVELEVLPACRAYGLAVIPWSPLAGGMLGGMLKAESTGRRKNLNPRYESMRPQIARWEEFCDAARRGARGGRTGVVARAAGCDVADHRAPHARTARGRVVARHADHARGRRAQGARRDLPRTRRRRARGVRLVARPRT